ncbi:MAG: hypothetical protein ACE5FU_01420 [Nitrospinota bacterium]
MICWVRRVAAMGEKIFPFLVFSLLFSCCFVRMAGAEVFYGEGKAPVVNGKKFPAQSFAHGKAFKKAVSLAVETLLRKAGNKTDFDLSEIMEGPFPFVDKEDLVERSIDKQSVMKIALKLHINMEKLADRLGQEGFQGLRAKKQDQATHKLIVVFAEEVDGKISKTPYISQVVHDFLQDRGFDVLLDEIIKKDVKNELAIQGMLRGDARAALNLAVNVGAVIVISGKLSLDRSKEKTGDMGLYLSNVSFQAINADSGRIIASVKNRGQHTCAYSERGVRECIAKAARKTGVQLVQALSREFKGGR